MKRIILILLLFSNYLTAQTWQPTSIRQRFVNGIGIPTRDTVTGTFSDSSQLVLRPQDSVIYYKYKGYWRALGGGAAAYTSVLQHEVKAGEALTKGQAVYVSSSDGTNMIVSKASNATEATSSKTMGLITSTLATNAKGYVITEGLSAGLNTSAASAGDPVWLGTGGNLIYGLTNKPTAPAHLVFIGIVTRSNSSNGEIFVKPQNGFELDELHDVAINSPRNQSILLYDSVAKLWRDTLASVITANNVNISDTAAMLIPYLRSNVAAATYEPKITAGTTAQYWRGDKSWQTLPVYTLAGLGGQPQLNGTGFVKASGTTISYDNSSYYLASNPNGYTSNTGTVTSVGGTGTVSGLTLTGSVTTSGSLTLGGSLTLTSAQITSGLGYTPYNATNPAGYITSSALSGYLPLTGGTLTGALNGTSATFSSSVAMSYLSVSGTDGLIGNFNSSNANGGYLTWQTSGAVIADIGTAQQIFGGGGNGTFGINARGARSLVFGTNNTLRATLDPSGNLGLGVTPSAWGSGYRAFQWSTLGSIYQGDSANIGFGNNMYVNSAGNNIYITSNYATLSDQYNGQHRWFTAPSGTAGNAISFTQAMTLNSSGNLGIGTTSPAEKLSVAGKLLVNTNTTDGANALQVNGSAKISSLAGTGERLVAADASGKLVVSANISSGYYTPTITLINGIASATASPLMYTNINGIVTVTGKITINSNSITEGNQLEINLPASNPNVSPNSVGGCGVEITTAPTRNQDVLNFNSAFNYAKIAITFKSNATGSKVYTFSFSYDSNYFP